MIESIIVSVIFYLHFLAVAPVAIDVNFLSYLELILCLFKSAELYVLDKTSCPLPQFLKATIPSRLHRISQGMVRCSRPSNNSECHQGLFRSGRQLWNDSRS